MKLEQRVQSFVTQHGLLEPGAKVLVALSGGADSVALLRMLMRLGYGCYAVHCNFHLRGEESDRDEAFVTELCHSLGVPFEVLHFDTEAYAAEHKVSIEMAARELRYHEFERIREVRSLSAIAVAHHQDDAVETLLLNLIRGAGINGLTGMRVKNGHVVRPLLCLSRDEVLEYLDWLGQSYVTDSTNLTDEYVRNKVRLGLIPLMEQINPAAKDNIAQAAARLADAATLYNKVIADTATRAVTPVESGVDIDIHTLMACEAPQAQLFEMLYPYGFNSRQIADIFRSLTGEAGRMFYAEEYMALKDRDFLCVRLCEKADEAPLYALPEEGRLELPDGTCLTAMRITPDASWRVPKDSNICVLDASRISAPLVVRHPQEGDRIHPFGMKGSKLLSDLYTDLKISRIDRTKQWLLCHDTDIVWAIGTRTNELYRIRGSEAKLVVISWK